MEKEYAVYVTYSGEFTEFITASDDESANSQAEEVAMMGVPFEADVESIEVVEID